MLLLRTKIECIILEINNPYSMPQKRPLFHQQNRKHPLFLCNMLFALQNINKSSQYMQYMNYILYTIYIGFAYYMYIYLYIVYILYAIYYTLYVIYYILYIIRYILHIIYYIMLPFDMLPASADLLCCFEETEKLNGEIQIKRRKISLQ